MARCLLVAFIPASTIRPDGQRDGEEARTLPRAPTSGGRHPPGRRREHPDLLLIHMAASAHLSPSKVLIAGTTLALARPVFEGRSAQAADGIQEASVMSPICRLRPVATLRGLLCKSSGTGGSESPRARRSYDQRVWILTSRDRSHSRPVGKECPPASSSHRFALDGPRYSSSAQSLSQGVKRSRTGCLLQCR